MCDLPDFKTVEERHAYFVENAPYFTVTCRFRGMAYHSDQQTLEKARECAGYVVKLTGRSVLIYGVICMYDELIETLIPPTNPG